jgi:hypothetical protein
MKNTLYPSRRRNSILLRTLLAFLLLPLSACEDFVQVDVPSTQLSSPLVFEDYSTATAALMAIYAKIRDSGLLTGNPGGMHAKLGQYTDELIFYGAGGQTDASFYNNAVLPTNTDVRNWWSVTYNQVYAVNALLEGVRDSESLSQPQKQQLTGEALFIRALLHFHLTNLYGPVPYIKSTEYVANMRTGRIDTGQVYGNAETDLLAAVELLGMDYLTPDRIRPNQATVRALLARLYLYSNRWAEAADSASAVLNHTALYQEDPNLDTVFLKGNPGNIWMLLPAVSGSNSLEAQSNVFLQGPPPTYALSPAFVNSFEPGDKRSTQWIKAVTNGTEVWYHANKYKAYNNSGGSLEYSIMFRTAELYLIRAEARARQGELASALADLNKVRNKAGLPNSTAATAEDIATAVIRERKSELFTESHRFFDLKRTNLLDQVLTPVKPGWNHDYRLLPLPETELLLNPNLNPQNPGY